MFASWHKSTASFSIFQLTNPSTLDTSPLSRSLLFKSSFYVTNALDHLGCTQSIVLVLRCLVQASLYQKDNPSPLCQEKKAFFRVSKPVVLVQGLDVVGVEGIQTAIDEFREEHPDIPLERLDRTSEGAFEVYAGPGLSILRGDFFELTSASAGTFDLVRRLF